MPDERLAAALPAHALVAWVARADLGEMAQQHVVPVGLYLCPECEGAGVATNLSDCPVCMGFREVRLSWRGLDPVWDGEHWQDAHHGSRSQRLRELGRSEE